MKVRALRTVYSRSQGKEFEKGQTFEAADREARVMMKLRKVEPAEQEAAPKPARQARATQRAATPPAPQAQQTFSTAALKAEEGNANPAQDPAQSPMLYRRRDMRPQE